MSVRPQKSVFPVIAFCIIIAVLYFLYHGVHNNSETTADDIKSLTKSEAIYGGYVERRKAIVQSHPELVDMWSPKNIYLFDYFLATFDCPKSVQRIGALGDGGKWVCGIETFESSSSIGSLAKTRKPCIVYSFGVAGDSSFEEEILERTHCEIFAFDASVQDMGPQILPDQRPRVHFYPTFIGTSESGDKTTLGAIMRKHGHSWVDIIKMDIEGSEFAVLDQVMSEFPQALPFGQLLLEIHVDCPFQEMYIFWEKLENAGLRPFRNEINLAPCVHGKALPTLSEYSFLNLKRQN
jgi:hypothetical protein